MPNIERDGAHTRQQILAAASDAFLAHGYAATTLEQVATELGITRGAVLHHFGSKSALLRSLLEPFFRELDSVLDAHERPGPLDSRQRRAFLVDFVACNCDHRAASAQLGRDIGSQDHMPPERRIADRADRFVRVLTGPAPDPLERLRAFAALGAILRPLVAPADQVDLSNPEARHCLVACAMQALRG